MKLPIAGIESPIARDLEWFHGRQELEIISACLTENEQLKKDLKKRTLAIVTRCNRSFYEKIEAWPYFKLPKYGEEEQKNLFGAFFKAITKLALSHWTDQNGHGILQPAERIAILSFMDYAFNGFEVDFVRYQIEKFLSFPIWVNLSDHRRQEEFKKVPEFKQRLQKKWNQIQKRDAKLTPDVLAIEQYERNFLVNYVKQFIQLLYTIPSQEEKPDLDDSDRSVINYCERFIEFLIDLESQLPLRRFFNAILDHLNIVVRCQESQLALRINDGRLFSQLVDMLQFYTKFELDFITGNQLTNTEVMMEHEKRILSLQKIIYKKFEDLKEFSLKSVSAIDTRAELVRYMDMLSNEKLFELLKSVHIGDESSLDQDDRNNRRLLLDLVVNRYERTTFQLQKINSMPLYPTEAVVWDRNLVPDQYYNYESSLSLPKLNLQFLTVNDYLLRNFILFRLESTYGIRQDLEDSLIRLRGYKNEDLETVFGAKARMASPIQDFSILEIGKPKLGYQCPSKVRARVVINLEHMKYEWKSEWQQLRKHDVCFLVTLRPTNQDSKVRYNPKEDFIPQVGLTYVRGCEIEGLLDHNGKLVDENLEKPFFENDTRTYLVRLDCNQYKADMDHSTTQTENIYSTFNVIVRRKPKQNNFKGVLETIRDLMNTKFVVPEWLNDLLIGHGRPDAAHYSNMENKLDTIDYFDTFLDYDHLVDSFKDRYTMTIKGCDNLNDEIAKPGPPFQVHFNEGEKRIEIESYSLPSRGPYPIVIPKKNVIRFTPTQVQAITSGLQPGLTMVVGPPGTGKTDVAVQILSTLYHSYPHQRTLIVTHSNQALNQIFEKLIDLDVEERHLLRLGHGEEGLQSDKNFSRYGRVEYVLTKRLELLLQCQKLAKSLDLDTQETFTCETANYFQFYHILPRWEEYVAILKKQDLNVNDISDYFPFMKFFEDAPQPLFGRHSIEEDLEVAKGCYRYIKKIFSQLEDFRAFELFRSGSDRSKYLLIREAKIIAMTCTHAGLRRKELVELNFQYDNILMEETAQILEIETTIPLLLQNPEHGYNRLKRWIMIGDQNQLPPIIQNTAFQKFSNMEQSLFARFVRLGVPTIDLDGQGRARQSLCDLYRWRYKNLRDLPHIHERPEYSLANAGFVHEYQLVNVEDYNNVGESTPMPYYYQNLGEAEYVVAVYIYMRLLGYPSEKITILTTYNGQKHLLREIVDRRCANDVLLGKPHKITTVDKYQGQQNDYILLSLVRTKTIGHLRDIRRLVVAMSRARLGLYVFARVSLFMNSFELQHSIEYFRQKPLKLCLQPEETYPTERRLGEKLNGQIVELDGRTENVIEFLNKFYTERSSLLENTNGHVNQLESPASPSEIQIVNKDNTSAFGEEIEAIDMGVQEDKASMDVNNEMPVNASEPMQTNDAASDP